MKPLPSWILRDILGAWISETVAEREARINKLEGYRPNSDCALAMEQIRNPTPPRLPPQ